MTAPARVDASLDPAVLQRDSRRFLGLRPGQVATLIRVVLALLPVFLVLLTIEQAARTGLNSKVAAFLQVTVPAVLAPLVWLAIRRRVAGPNGEHDAPSALPATFVCVALLATSAFLVLQRLGQDVPGPVALVWFGLSTALVLVAVPLARRTWEFVAAGVAASFVFLAYVLFTTTTHPFYFGATDLMAFRPSLLALADGASIEEALPETSSGLYDAFPSYFLVGAAAALLTGQEAMRATFQVYALMYPFACLLFVGVLRRFGVQERVAWMVFVVALAARPMLTDATYPTPRSLVFLFTIVLIALFAVAWRAPRAIGPGLFVLVAFVDLLLAVLHKVSGFFALVPLAATLAVAVPFMARSPREVRAFAAWTAGLLMAAYLAYALFVSGGLNDALARVEEQSGVGGAAGGDVDAWTAGETLGFLAANLDVLVAVTLALVGAYFLMAERGTGRWRIHPVGVALLALLALQLAYYSVLYGLPGFSSFRLARLAHGAALYAAIPIALLLVALVGRPTQQPVKATAAIVLAALFATSSYGVAYVNQDLALERRDVQYTSSFDGPEITALTYGERFTGDIHCDAVACLYYEKSPLIRAVKAKVYDPKVPFDRVNATLEKLDDERVTPGFVLERSPEIEAGYARVVVESNGRNQTRLVEDAPVYLEELRELQRSHSILFSSDGIRWYLL